MEFNSFTLPLGKQPIDASVTQLQTRGIRWLTLRCSLKGRSSRRQDHQNGDLLHRSERLAFRPSSLNSSPGSASATTASTELFSVWSNSAAASTVMFSVTSPTSKMGDNLLRSLSLNSALAKRQTLNPFMLTE